MNKDQISNCNFTVQCKDCNNKEIWHIDIEKESDEEKELQDLLTKIIFKKLKEKEVI